MARGGLNQDRRLVSKWNEHGASHMHAIGLGVKRETNAEDVPPQSKQSLALVYGCYS